MSLVQVKNDPHRAGQVGFASVQMSNGDWIVRFGDVHKRARFPSTTGSSLARGYAASIAMIQPDDLIFYET